jgi:tRNA A37 threonylcarbamoyladenosine dehydratase
VPLALYRVCCREVRIGDDDQCEVTRVKVEVREWGRAFGKAKREGTDDWIFVGMQVGKKCKVGGRDKSWTSWRGIRGIG